MMQTRSPQPTGVSAPVGARLDLGLGVGMVIAGLALVFWLIPAQVDDSGSFGLPPSLAPKVLAWMMVGLGAVLTGQRLLRAGDPEAGPKLALADLAHLALCVVTVTVMLGVMALVGGAIDRPYAGFLIGAPIGLVALTVIHTGAPRWAFVFNAVAVPAAIYVAFWWGLQLPLP